jgi:hypothetical protein
VQWSAIKKRAESFLAKELQGRVRFFITSYSEKNRNEGRAWITLDHVEIFSTSGFERPGARQEFFEILRDFPNRSVEELLNSDNELQRAIAILDRRIGKRTLERLKGADLSELERKFLAARLKKL